MKPSRKQKAELKGRGGKHALKYTVNILACPFESAFCFLLGSAGYEEASRALRRRYIVCQLVDLACKELVRRPFQNLSLGTEKDT